MLKRKHALLVIIALLTSTTTFAFGGAPLPEPQKTLAETIPPGPRPVAEENTKRIDEELQRVFKAAEDRLQKVELLLSEGKHSEAKAVAKNLLDQVKRKAGINPKGNYREMIETEILDDSDLSKPFSALGASKRDQITRIVTEHRHGFFLDVLNMAKRATLLHMRASYLVYKDVNGKLKESDVQKLKSDLKAVFHIVILLNGSRQSVPYPVFDTDVADSDQIYDFNSELTDFALSVPELRFTEASFTKFVDQSKTELFRIYVNEVNARREAKAMKREAEAMKKAAIEKRVNDCIAENKDWFLRWVHFQHMGEAARLCERDPQTVACVKNMIEIQRPNVVLYFSSEINSCTKE